LGHFGDGAVSSVGANDNVFFIRLRGKGGQGGGQQQWVKHPETLVHTHSFYELTAFMLFLVFDAGASIVTDGNKQKNLKADFARSDYCYQYHLQQNCA
jgi:hypothetical protein